MRSIAPVAAFSLLLAACSGSPGVAGRGGKKLRPTAKASQVVTTAQLEEKLVSALAAAPSAEALSLASRIEQRGRTLSQVESLRLMVIADSLSLGELVELPGQTLASAIVDLRRALLLRHQGDLKAAHRSLRRAEHADLLRPQLESLRARLKSKTVDARRIAVLLPMSGKYAAIGEELWAGMSLALDSSSDAVVSVYDTQGTEEGATKAVRDALEAGSVLAVGPAGRLESAAAARAAAAADLPIALLAPAANAANAEAGVFRLALSPDFEAEQAAIVAFELGYRLVAVMAPRDELGRAQTRAFVAAAEAAGAEVVAVGGYDPSSANLEKDFKKFLGLEVTVNRRYRQHLRRYGRGAWKSFTPTLGFDFLYMPDTVERGGLAASYLPFFNVEVRSHDEMSIGRLRSKHRGLMPRVVQLMGGSSWLDPSLGARGGAAVEGALVIGTCPGGLGMDLSERGRQFADDFTRQQRRAPSAAAAAANDAMTIVLQVREWAASHGGQRDDAARALRSAQLRDGNCGTLSMDARGQLQGEIEVLRVEQGSLEIYEY